MMDSPCSQQTSDIGRAAAILQRGAPVVLPTETVYGLAANAADPQAVKTIYQIKGRTFDKALPIMVFSALQAREIAQVSPLAQALMDAFWPGPLTIVLPVEAGAKIAKAALAGGQTVALRCPDTAWVKAFLDLGLNFPLALTSANTSGQPAPVTAQQARDDIGGKVELILDGGPCDKGLPSTIVGVSRDTVTVFRDGALGRDALAPFGKIGT